ncbi:MULTISPECIES: hypothetical protein [Frankia]|uniref:hypothetical protein n=1 Tax=Frankia TaxID=1854 RepID=UPI000A5289C9|nr:MULTISPECIES: hypothetical protein [Frankia]
MDLKVDRGGAALACGPVGQLAQQPRLADAADTRGIEDARSRADARHVLGESRQYRFAVDERTLQSRHPAKTWRWRHVNFRPSQTAMPPRTMKNHSRGRHAG